MTGPVVTAVPGKPNLLLGSYDVAALGYRAEEFFISGTATSYAATGDLNADGRWRVAPARDADYTTRIVVLTPEHVSAFNGTVLVEWLNVSGGIDAPAVWFMAHREMLREGYAYVAVSAQEVGVQGGDSPGGHDMSLKTQDPVRYAPLRHPGDAFSYDVFSQIGRLVRSSQPGGVLSALTPEHVLAVGESQSAMYLTTYVNAVDPLAEVYDGFLVHSRFAPAAPLDGVSMLEPSSATMPDAVRIRPDLRVPVLVIITETDLLGGPLLAYYTARQPDEARLRVWEIPGTAHADNYTIQVAPIDTGFAPLSAIVAAYAPTTTLMGEQVAQPINFGPQHHYVLQAALAGLRNWVRTGEPAPSAPQIELSAADPPQLVLDDHGIAKGGVWTPWVDVPIARTSGLGGDGNFMASLFGSGEVFDAATVASLYPGGSDEYLRLFEIALDEAVRSGFIVAADRGEILELAAATYPLNR
ncbi:MAG: alpha/beta hydrolase domain-containing protein [Mycobacterium sp.]